MLRSIGLTVRGIREVSREEEKEGYGGKDLQEKRGFKPGMKKWEGDGILIIVSISVSSVPTVERSRSVILAPQILFSRFLALYKFVCMYVFTRIMILWWRGSVVERRSLAGELSLSCARPAADG